MWVNGACQWVPVVSLMLGGKPFRGGPVNIPGKGSVMAYYDDGECVDGPQGCQGETFPRLAAAGAG